MSGVARSISQRNPFSSLALVLQLPPPGYLEDWTSHAVAAAAVSHVALLVSQQTDAQPINSVRAVCCFLVLVVITAVSSTPLTPNFCFLQIVDPTAEGEADERTVEFASMLRILGQRHSHSQHPPFTHSLWFLLR